MPFDFVDANQLSLIGAELATLGDAIAVIATEKIICKEDDYEIAKNS